MNELSEHDQSWCYYLSVELIRFNLSKRQINWFDWLQLNCFREWTQLVRLAQTHFPLNCSKNRTQDVMCRYSRLFPR